MTIGWPEGIILGMTVLYLFLMAVADGTPRTGTNKFSLALVSTALNMGLLWWGGFFA